MYRLTSLVMLVAVAGINVLNAATGPSDGSAPPATAPATGPAPTDAAGSTPPPGSGASSGDVWSLMLPLIILVAFMYFVMIRPQKKEQQKRQSMLGELKVGEKVVTIGGLHGTITRRGENDVDLEVSDGVKMTFNLGAIHERVADKKE